MKNQTKKLVSAQEALIMLEKNKTEVFLTMGAGDIDLLVEPVTKILQS
jgi:UDP-N-acetylmuramate-alanine ligase